MDAVYSLANNIVNAQYGALSKETIDSTKTLILDTLAVGIGGSSEPGARELLDIFRDWDGKKESTVLVFGDKLPCINAAQVNATMIHALDYDDTHDKAVIHAGVITLPVALAMAEKIGGIDGKKMITALALGVDVSARLCLANTVSMFDRGWHYTTLHGHFGAATVAGKLLDLDKETMVSALGLAYHQAGGNIQCADDGVLAKRLGPGFAVRDGILAALMSQKGLTGPTNVLQGRRGLFNVYHRGDYNPEVLTANLGDKYEVVNLSFKPYPCCRNNHPSIDAALDLIREYKLTIEDIDKVTVYVGKGAYFLLCHPIDVKQDPQTIVDAQFSLPWAVAIALVHHKVGIKNFGDYGLQDSSVRWLAGKIHPQIDESLTRIGASPAVVEIKTTDGKLYSKRVDAPYGSPDNPMNFDAMSQKLKDCGDNAAKPLPDKNLEKLVHIISHLEEVDDVGEIMRILC